jgi:hypothetical protein
MSRARIATLREAKGWKDYRFERGGVPKARFPRSSGSLGKGAKRPKSFGRYCGIQKTQVDRCSPQILVPNPQHVLPLPEVAFEAHALGDLEARDDTPLPRLRPGSIGIRAQMPSIGCPNGSLSASFRLAGNTRYRLLTNRLRRYASLSHRPGFGKESEAFYTQ